MTQHNTSYPLRRFLLFEFDTYYPGGMDLVGSADTLEEAQKLLWPTEVDNAGILDSATGQRWWRDRYDRDKPWELDDAGELRYG